MSDQYYDDQPSPSSPSHDVPSPISQNNGLGHMNGAPTSAGAPAQYDQYSSSGVKHEYGNGNGNVKQEPYDSPVKPTPMQAARKSLASWVGFSNLPNQVHRRANK